MVGDDDVCPLYRLPGLEVGTIAKEGAAATCTTTMIGGHGGPAVIVDGVKFTKIILVKLLKMELALFMINQQILTKILSLELVVLVKNTRLQLY